MRAVPAEMDDASGLCATTLASAWRLVRRDGRVFGFTDHDEELRFAGTAFSAGGGLSAGEVETGLGLGVDAAGVEGALGGEALEEREIAAGLFDGARIELFRVDWQAPDMRHVLLETFELGEVTRGAGAFRAELRGLATRLDRVHGRRFRRRCDAEIGDRRCGVALGVAGRRRAASVTGVGGGVLAIRIEGALEPADFAHGHLRLADGRRFGVLALRPGGAPGEWRAECLEEVPADVAAGSGAELSIGCDRSFRTCRDRFANAVNFRGFPHLPGSDAALGVAKRDLAHDGAPVVP